MRALCTFCLEETRFTRTKEVLIGARSRTALLNNGFTGRYSITVDLVRGIRNLILPAGAYPTDNISPWAFIQKRTCRSEKRWRERSIAGRRGRKWGKRCNARKYVRRSISSRKITTDFCLQVFHQRSDVALYAEHVKLVTRIPSGVAVWIKQGKL